MGLPLKPTALSVVFQSRPPIFFKRTRTSPPKSTHQYILTAVLLMQALTQDSSSSLTQTPSGSAVIPFKFWKSLTSTSLTDSFSPRRHLESNTNKTFVPQALNAPTPSTNIKQDRPHKTLFLLLLLLFFLAGTRVLVTDCCIAQSLLDHRLMNTTQTSPPPLRPLRDAAFRQQTENTPQSSPLLSSLCTSVPPSSTEQCASHHSHHHLHLPLTHET